ncbi:MAG: class I SAM-dependent methyltransferase [Acidimicrobiales bacterium]
MSGVVPSLEQISRATGRAWVIEDIHNFGPDYDQTLLAWHDNIEKRWHEIPHYDKHFRRTWQYYLLASAAAFRVRNLQLWQIVFRRTRQETPTYIAVL